MLKNNNPGNIRSFVINGKYSKPFVGETLPPDIKPGKTAGFRIFKSLPYGYRALFSLLKYGYLDKGYNTIELIFPRYAPSSDFNNPGSYINTVEQMTGIKRNTILKTFEDLIPVVKAITKVETNTTANDQAVKEGYNLIKGFNLPDLSPGTTQPDQDPDKKKKIILVSTIALTLILSIYAYNKRNTKYFNW